MQAQGTLRTRGQSVTLAFVIAAAVAAGALGGYSLRGAMALPAFGAAVDNGTLSYPIQLGPASRWTHEEPPAPSIDGIRWTHEERP